MIKTTKFKKLVFDKTIYKNKSLAGTEDKVLGLEEYNKLVGLPEIREKEKKYKTYGEEIATDFSVKW